ncbi:hypothetical protein [Nocardia sp. NPDC051570]|uniref:hypothetical protein n=1 Tax=Nocardia sp. NPDC051570 TaxID=3364324 RepID=UPI0037A29794
MTSPKAPSLEYEPTLVRDDFVRTVDGVEIRLPSLAYLKPGLIRRIRRLNDTDAICTLLESTLDPVALAAVDDMDPADFQQLMNEWRVHSGVDLGES